MNGIVDPEICLNYQIDKLLEAESNTECEPVIDNFNSDEYKGQSAAWKKQAIW